MQVESKIPSILIYCDITSGGGVYVYTKALMSLLGQCVKFYLITHEPVNQADRYRLELLSVHASNTVFIKNGLSNRLILNEIVSAINSLQPSFYIPNYREAPHAAVITAKKNGCKTIYIAHNDHYEQYKFAVRYQDNIDYFLSPSVKCRDVLTKILKKNNIERCVLIPHYIESPDVDLKRSHLKGPIKLIYNGRITFEQKQLYYLVDIANELLERNLKFHFDVVGDGENKNDLLQKFKDAGIDDSYFTFHGHVPHEDLQPYFIANDAVMLVSSYEGFCLGLAEAMAYGLPAVAFTCGGVINDYLVDGQNGFLVPQGDVGVFVDKVEALINNEKLYNSMSENAKSVIKEKFNSEVVTEGYKNVFFDNKTPVSIEWPYARPILLTGQQNAFLHVIEYLGCVIFGWNKLPKKS